ncbi:PGN_0703 family putative restriction endonuclease [Bradyrhizobium sp. 2S1]|uniref:PGN_0703 family putative restriction endonuclease n=1 Tax=Bradyrhizobium sp. 2S1 TaxID=1404429 RepID=UPI00140CBD4E|nr:hypothetical protein [Bradyrhizobium sp. 2S1]MCK7666446.1 hypothetical protein [Bradyrhizobium sp. 2S1]
MGDASKSYQTDLRRSFAAYRSAYFSDHLDWFEPRPPGGAVVFTKQHRENNLLIPPCSAANRQGVVAKIPTSKRHRHFGSMQSSQALAQSVFGVIEVLGRLPLLAAVRAEDGRLAFGPLPNRSHLEFEKGVTSLGEVGERVTSVDVWFEGPYRVAIECKLAETEFGTCSRTRLKKADKNFEEQFCDGSYTKQRGREHRCALTELNINYWRYTEGAFGWAPNVDYINCPLRDTYQIARNILAVGVAGDGGFDESRGHALLMYDQRNPAMLPGGWGDHQWLAASGAIQNAGTLRRLSWQSLIGQWPADEVLSWMKTRLGEKYGLHPAN